MKKIETLKKSYQFKKVLNKGKRYYGHYIDVLIIPNNKNRNYIGIAISSKLAKATQRNRIKRLIRENYRLIQPNLENGYNLVILCRKNANIPEITFDKIYIDVQDIFKKAGLYN